MIATRFKIGFTVVGLAALCRCSLAYDLEELDNGRGGAGADASAGGAGSGGDDASFADATNDGLAGAGGTTFSDAANDSSGGIGGTDVRDAASDSSDSGPAPDGGTLTLGLVAHYRFDETRGSSAADATRNNQPATLVDGANFASGIQGNAVSLDGDGEHVSLPANIVQSYRAFSISVWVRLNTTPSGARVFDFGTGTTRYMFLSPRTSTNQTRFGISTGGIGAEQQLSTAALSTGNWHHVAVTLAGNTGTFYVDGAQVAQNTSMTLTPADLDDTNRNWLGRSQYTSDPFFDGRIDNLRMYSRALTLQEVQMLEA
ncbi:MAG TPA: LamG domain-containing protein, partial [Polyangiaceae bacterium]|nr:LamG domain-containing protein [Polyangiaceae bacterium]